MINTLRGKLMLANVTVFLAAMSVFGGVQLSMSSRNAERLLDEAMLARARDMARGPRPGPPARRGNPPLEANPSGPPPEQPMGQGGGEAMGQGGVEDNPIPEGSMGQLRPPIRMQDRLHPSIIRRPSFVMADGRVFPVSEELPIWSPTLLEESKNGRVARGYENAFGMRLRVISMPIPAPNGRFDVIQVVEDASGIELARRSQLLSLASTLPFALVAALAASWLLSRFVLEPVHAMSKWAVKLANDPLAADRIPKQSTSEMDSLAHSMNSMADGMQTANEQISGALERQRQFTSDAAHELRTPLTSLKLAAENGLHPEATPGEMRRSLEVVDRSATSLAGLLEMLLSLSRLDAAKAVLPLERVDLEKTVNDALALAGLQGDPRISLELEGRTVLANAGAVKQIFVNLLTNAAAHTPVGGQIRIYMDGVKLAVSDTGTGISPEHLDRIFDRFYRVDESRSRASGGHGLGLAIVKSLVEAQGGSVSVESEVGVGTKFFVTFCESPENS